MWIDIQKIVAFPKVGRFHHWYERGRLAVVSANPPLSTHCVGQPISGSPVKIAAVDFDDHGDGTPTTDKFLSMADYRMRLRMTALSVIG